MLQLEECQFMKICFATHNLNKLQEVRKLLGKDFELVSLEEMGQKTPLPETKDTLEGNAFDKAAYVFSNYQIPCFADDTGLEVEALNKAPGVYSARYAGPQKDAEDNKALLLAHLAGITNRRAQFRTVIAFMSSTTKQQFEGIVKGHIVEQPSGKQGFGYDAIFVPDGYTKTFAEMSLKEKNTISHRAIAFKKLLDFLKTNFD